MKFENHGPPVLAVVVNINEILADPLALTHKLDQLVAMSVLVGGELRIWSGRSLVDEEGNLAHDFKVELLPQ